MSALCPCYNEINSSVNLCWTHDSAIVLQAQKEREKGNEAYKKKNFRQALTHYDRAIDLDPSDALLHSNKASVYIALDQLDKAKSSCLTAINIAQVGDHHDKKDIAK